MKRKQPSHERPKIDLYDAQRASFTYSGQTYRVASAPSSVFKAAVLEKAPMWNFHDQYTSILRKREIDMLDRWYLMCCLEDTHRGIMVPASEQVAG
jgi:hypothetical protein